MKSLLATIALSLFVTTSVFASPVAPKCQAQAEKSAMIAAKKAYKGDEQLNETRSITGSKLLHKGGILETYLVGYSDEVEPADIIVVLDSNKNCVTKFSRIATENRSDF